MIKSKRIKYDYRYRTFMIQQTHNRMLFLEMLVSVNYIVEHEWFASMERKHENNER